MGESSNPWPLPVDPPNGAQFTLEYQLDQYGLQLADLNVALKIQNSSGGDPTVILAQQSSIMQIMGSLQVSLGTVFPVIIPDPRW
jgi:hypothetical protein